MVVTSTDKPEAPLAVYDIEEEIDKFWEENKFVYEMAVDPVIVVADDYDEDFYSDKIFGKKRRLERTGGALVITSMLAVAGGVVSYNLMDDKNLGVGLLSLGGASFIAGTIFLLQSGTIPDPPEGWVSQPVEPEKPETEKTEE